MVLVNYQILIHIDLQRGSKGVISLKVNDKTGNMIFANVVNGKEDLLMLTS